MIVNIEGVDYSGKTVQALRLTESMRGAYFKFPNRDTPIGKLIDGHLKREWCVGCGPAIRADMPLVDATVFQALQIANRCEMMPKVQQALLDDQHVVFDRWKESGYVYGCLEGVSIEAMEQMQEFLPDADLNVLIDIDLSDARARCRPEVRDRYETNASFVNQVINTYRKRWVKKMLVEKNPCYVIVDGRETMDEVEDAILRAVKKREQDL